MGVRPSRLGAKAHPKCPLLCVLCWLAGWLCAQAKVCDVNTELKLHQFHPSNSQCVLVCVQGMGYATEVGEGPGRGFNVNVGWAEKGVGDADYMSGAAGGGGTEWRQAALRVTGVRDPAQTLQQSCLV